VYRKLYITGGIGPSAHNEGFTQPFDLPNETAYAENLCSHWTGIWNHRMLQLDCDRRYADVMERALYNGVISGVSLDGEKFFYENPLASLGNHHRQAWFDCACCPPNLARILASLGEYIYSQSDTDLAVHLYVQGTASTQLGGQCDHAPPGDALPVGRGSQHHLGYGLAYQLWIEAALTGLVSFSTPVSERRSHLSSSGWIHKQQAGCYLRIERVWKPGDSVHFEMDMPVERIYAHPDVRQDRGMVALQRGPLVFCLKQVDNSAPLQHIYLPEDADMTSQFDPDVLSGMVSINGPALAVDASDWRETLYSTALPV